MPVPAMHDNIVTSLRATLDPQHREDGEKVLHEMHKILQFAPQLLQIVMSQQIEDPVRQAGAIYLKNYMVSNWSHLEPEHGELMAFSIHESDKVIIRESIIEAITHSTRAIRVQLCVVVNNIIKEDFPERWSVEQLSVKLLEILQSNRDHETVMGGLLVLHQFLKVHEYKKIQDCVHRNEVMSALLPCLYDRCVTNLLDNSEPIMNQYKLILKIFYVFTQYTLPRDIVTHELLGKWMLIFSNLLERPVPDFNDLDNEDKQNTIYWKTKKWVLRIVLIFFERYGSPGNVSKEYEAFAKEYMARYSSGAIVQMLKVLDLKRNGKFVSDSVLKLVLNYLNNAVNHPECWKILRIHIISIVQNIIFPLMCHSEEDDEMWMNDPHEYIRRKYDIFGELFSPVSAAQRLLNSVAGKRKNMIHPVVEMCLTILNSDGSNPRHVDGALHIIGSLAETMMKKKPYKNVIDDMIGSLVFPKFNESQHKYLKARACWVVLCFGNAKFNNHDSLAHGLQRICELLIDKAEDLPVRVSAAITLQGLIGCQPHVQSLIGGEDGAIPQILNALLELIHETETDDLNSVIQKFICEYGDKVADHAEGIAKHLVGTFQKLLESEDSAEDGNDKSLTAVGILNTLETLLEVMECHKETMIKLEPAVLPVINHILDNCVIEFYEEAFSLVYNLTACQISPDMWCILPKINNLFLDDAFDYFNDMMPALYHYVTTDSEAFRSDKRYLHIIVSMCQKVLQTQDSDEDFQCSAAKLLEVVLLQHKGYIDEIVPQILEIPINRVMTDIETSELRQICLQVLIVSLYCNPDLFFKLLDMIPNVTECSFTQKFITRWIDDTDCFFGVHDRKVCILGLCVLMQCLPVCLPHLMDDNDVVQKILPSLLLLCTGLKKAYVKRAERENLDSDDDSDEEEEDDKEEDMHEDDHLISASDVIDFQDHDDGVGDEDDDDEEDDDDSYEEAQFDSYTTPLDEDDCPVDEFVTLKETLQKLSLEQPIYYAKLTNFLNVDQNKELQELLYYADQRLAYHQSRQIEKDGGYRFVQTSVPGHFQFVGQIPGDFKFGGDQ